MRSIKSLFEEEKKTRMKEVIIIKRYAKIDSN